MWTNSSKTWNISFSNCLYKFQTVYLNSKNFNNKWTVWEYEQTVLKFEQTVPKTQIEEFWTVYTNFKQFLQILKFPNSEV